MHGKLTDRIIKDRLSGRKIKLISPYVSANNKNEFQCTICGNKFIGVARYVINGPGIGCRNCQNNSMKLPKSIIDDRLRSRRITLIGPYYNSSSKHDLRCDVCGGKWYGVLHRGCPHCATNYILPSDISRRLKDKSIKILDNYVNGRHRVNFQCAKCNHIWKTSAKSVISGTAGCPHCYNLSRSKSLLLHPDIVEKRKNGLIKIGIKLMSPFLGVMALHDFVCLVCDYKWSTTFDSVWRGSKCSRCSSRRVGSGVKENWIRNLIERATKHRFPKCRPEFLFNRKTGRKSELDGYCHELKIAFEFNGYQHYSTGGTFKISAARLRRQKLSDLRKRVQCLRHGVLLIVIPYWKTEKEIKKLITSKLLKRGVHCYV